jgi:hypothetical protein
MTIDEFVSLIRDDGIAAPGPSAVAEFERTHSLILPEDYRAFLTMTAGGRVQGNVHFSLAGEEDGPEIMGSVFGLQPEDYCSLVRAMADVEEDAIPQGLLPVMRDRGGNTIALAIRRDRLGEMVFLDHEVADEGRPTLEEAEDEDWGYAIVFARSFTAMIAGFKLADD